MLPIKSNYIDSHFKSSGSASDSDFKIDLPTTQLMPEDTGFYIDDVGIPHAWCPFEAGVNDSIMFKQNGTNLIIQVPAGNYSVKYLSVAIVNARNALMFSPGCLL